MILTTRDGRIGWSLLDGEHGERWVRDRDLHGWGRDRAYAGWRPADEAARLRALDRYQTHASSWVHPATHTAAAPSAPRETAHA